jgi:phosphoglycolate phosphatase-like HAD superfamily hydrolase
MFKIVISDLDGTLVDSAGFYYRSSVSIFKTFGVQPPSFQAFRREITGNIPGFFYRHGLSRSVTPEAIDKMTFSYVREHWQEYTIHPGARTALALCRGLNIPFFILSHNIDGVIKNAIKKFELGLFVTEAISSGNKSESLFAIVRKCRVSPQDVLFMDDTASGIRDGKNAGVATLGFLGGYESKWKISRARPDFKTASFQDVMRVIVRRRI